MKRTLYRVIKNRLFFHCPRWWENGLLFHFRMLYAVDMYNLFVIRMKMRLMEAELSEVCRLLSILYTFRRVNMTLLQPQTLKLYYLIFDSLAISAILRPEVRKVLSPPHCQRKSCCCLHINPVCRFVLASQPQRFVFFHSQMKCGSGIELVSDGGRAMNPLLSPGSILKEPRGSWKTPSFPADEGVFPWGKWEVWGKRFENWDWRMDEAPWAPLFYW